MVSYDASFQLEGSKMTRKIENNRLEAFHKLRREGNKSVREAGYLGIKRFFNLDTNAYKDAALPGKTKELPGLVASAVLRCNDCIDYHLEQCAHAGFTRDEMVDAMNVALIVGGSVVIPYLQHAMETLDILEQEGVLNR